MGGYYIATDFEGVVNITYIKKVLFYKWLLTIYNIGIYRLDLDFLRKLRLLMYFKEEIN